MECAPCTANNLCAERTRRQQDPTCPRALGRQAPGLSGDNKSREDRGLVLELSLLPQTLRTVCTSLC